MAHGSRIVGGASWEERSRHLCTIAVCWESILIAIIDTPNIGHEFFKDMRHESLTLTARMQIVKIRKIKAAIPVMRMEKAGDRIEGMPRSLVTLLRGAGGFQDFGYVIFPRSHDLQISRFYD